MAGCWPLGMTGAGCMRACNFRTSTSMSALLASSSFANLSLSHRAHLRPNPLAFFSSLSIKRFINGSFHSVVGSRSQFEILGSSFFRNKCIPVKRLACIAQEREVSGSSSKVVGPIVLTRKVPTTPNVPTFADGNIGFKQAEDGTGGGPGETGLSDMIFLGTGTSEGVPRVSCLTNHTKHCAVCWAATRPGDRNRRRNTSVLVRYAHPDGRTRHILIDAGKFFYHSALQWFPYFGVRQLDAVIITHSHADAIGGLDDLRDWTNNVQNDIPIYVAGRDLEVMKKTHYYLVDPSGITKGTAVSKLQFKLITEEPFFVQGLKVIPLPVWHGPGYRSLGFRIGNLCYISDVSEIPQETYPLLEDCETLILDALRPDRSSSTHFGLPAALEEVRKIRPKKTLFTGMMHTTDHNAINGELAALLETEGLDMELSYDGMRVHFNPEL